jgi:hypothetical protein
MNPLNKSILNKMFKKKSSETDYFIPHTFSIKRRNNKLIKKKEEKNTTNFNLIFLLFLHTVYQYQVPDINTSTGTTVQYVVQPLEISFFFSFFWK